MKLGRQRAEGCGRETLRRLSGLGTRVLYRTPLAGYSQITNDIPPLRPPHAEIPPTFWEQHTTGVALLGFALLALIGITIRYAARSKPPGIVSPGVQVRGELETLSKVPEDGLVLSKVSQAVRRYFGVAFALPPGERTTAEFCQAIAANDRVGSDLAVAASDFLRRCDECKFAPDAPPQATGAAEYALKLVAQAETRREQWRAAQTESESGANT